MLLPIVNEKKNLFDVGWLVRIIFWFFSICHLFEILFKTFISKNAKKKYFCYYRIKEVAKWRSNFLSDFSVEQKEGKRTKRKKRKKSEKGGNETKEHCRETIGWP